MKKKTIPEEETSFQIMMKAVLLGITPDDYAEFHAMVNGIIGDDDADGRVNDTSNGYALSSRDDRRHIQAPSHGMEDASEKTLTLRVQMQDVTKPPMWRELRIPADFTFFQLHQAIQVACGFEDAHLWQFQRKAYNPELQIGIPADHTDPDELGLEEWTHDARTTGITAFLAEKGQKLVYVYDFGDDWIFTVSVVDITPRDGETAECTRWKSDMQPLEDCGGTWGYMNMRSAWSQRDSLTKRQKKELADTLGYNSFDELEEVIIDSQFDLKVVNEILAEI